MFGIGGLELIFILLIGLIVLGPKQLPELARSIGKLMAQFRNAMNSVDELGYDESRNVRDGSKKTKMGAGQQAEMAHSDREINEREKKGRVDDD